MAQMKMHRQAGELPGPDVEPALLEHVLPDLIRTTQALTGTKHTV